ncbi:MAG: DNA-binding protein WhiA [Clostridiales bacterium]|jgi:DNA-binding protein WhiA|nr:DNA-binding protein WhiA [Clostridiales bacterium]
MSFSSDVKNELCGVSNASRHCAIAEMAAIVNTCGFVGEIRRAEDESVSKVANAIIRIQTENFEAAKKFFSMLQQYFNISGEISVRNRMQCKNARICSVRVCDPAQTRALAGALGFLRRDSQEHCAAKTVSPIVTMSECCKKAYIRGAFIAGGSLCNPDKNYHLEFVQSEMELGEGLVGLIGGFGLNAKMIPRKGHYIVYLKEGENIVDLLNIMGAHKSLMEMENTRIIREIRNHVNRAVNCEAANISKTVSAAVKQISDIHTIESMKGLGYLGDQLEEVARMRMLYDEATLKEIGSMLSPPVGKSGVSHRLRKISEIAENLRGGLS